MSGKYAFIKTLREVRFHFCQTSEGSAAIRTWLSKAYPTMKKNNPHIPIMLREALEVEPRIYTRYEYGKEKSESLAGMDDKQIEDSVTGLVKTDIAS